MKTFHYIFSFIIIFNSQAFATEKTCQVQGAVRCLCPASMSVSCDGTTGYIKNEEKLNGAIFSVTMADGKQKTITLTKAQLEKNKARDLYGINYQKDLKSSLGLSENDKIEVSSFTIDSSINLYSDTYGEHPLPNGNSGNNFSANYANETYKGCQLASDYEIYKLSTEAVAKCKCTNKIPVICSARVYCDSSSEFGTGGSVTVCPQVNGKCPSLKDCIEDTYVDADAFSKEKNQLYKKETTNANGADR